MKQHQNYNRLTLPALIYRASLLIILGISASFLSPRSLLAETINICVICNDPGKVYQCGIAYEPVSETLSEPNRQGLQLACIQEIAKYGNHSQCASSRKTGDACGGEPYTLKDQSSLYTPRETVVETDAPPADISPTPEIQKQKPEEQPTLVDSTEKTYEQAKETVKDSYEKTSETVKTGYDKTKTTVKTVGDSIGSAAKTTYNCLTSFFTKCSE